MPFTHEVEVVEADIDNLGHASNLVYLRWVQEAALGFPETAYLARGQAWVVRTHEIEYLKGAVLGDRLRIETRVATMKVANSLRKTEILRAASIQSACHSEWLQPGDDGMRRALGICVSGGSVGRREQASNPTFRKEGRGFRPESSSGSAA